MFDSLNILFIIGNLTFVIILIICFFVLKISWDDAKKEKNVNIIQEQRVYAPYNCDEETENYLSLSTSTRLIAVVSSLWAVIELLYFFYSSSIFYLLQGIGIFCASLFCALIPTKVLIESELITLTYSILFFTRTIRISKREISHIIYHRKNTLFGQNVNISIVRLNQKRSRILYLYNRDERTLINNSKIVLLKISSILKNPTKSIRVVS